MEQKINQTALVGLANNSFVANLQRTKKQEVLDLIEGIKYEHRVGTSAMMGPYSDREAKHEYEKLLSALDGVPGLSQEEKVELTALINAAIENIPNVEKEKEEEYLEAERQHKEAFERAKARFKVLSPVKQLKLKLAGKDPDSIDVFWKTVKQIDELYIESR